jgi:hypothetical protein
MCLMQAPEPKQNPQPPDGLAPFDPNLTQVYQVKLKNKAPVWFASLLAGNEREKLRLRSELGRLKHAVPLLMKQRNGGRWTADERNELRRLLHSASNVSPYLLIWAVPGSMVLLPFMAWFLDVRRKNREAKRQ